MDNSFVSKDVAVEVAVVGRKVPTIAVAESLELSVTFAPLPSLVALVATDVEVNLSRAFCDRRPRLMSAVRV